MITPMPSTQTKLEVIDVRGRKLRALRVVGGPRLGVGAESLYTAIGLRATQFASASVLLTDNAAMLRVQDVGVPGTQIRKLMVGDRRISGATWVLLSHFFPKMAEKDQKFWGEWADAADKVVFEAGLSPALQEKEFLDRIVRQRKDLQHCRYIPIGEAIKAHAYRVAHEQYRGWCPCGSCGTRVTKEDGKPALGSEVHHFYCSALPGVRFVVPLQSACHTRLHQDRFTDWWLDVADTWRRRCAYSVRQLCLA